MGQQFHCSIDASPGVYEERVRMSRKLQVRSGTAMIILLGGIACYLLVSRKYDCENPIADAEQASAEGERLLLSKYFGHLLNRYKTIAVARKSFESGDLYCEAFPHGGLFSFTASTWRVGCRERVAPDCGPPIDITFDLDKCGSVTNLLPYTSNTPCPKTLSIH